MVEVVAVAALTDVTLPVSQEVRTGTNWDIRRLVSDPSEFKRPVLTYQKAFAGCRKVSTAGSRLRSGFSPETYDI